jgi:hypothetical protein
VLGTSHGHFDTRLTTTRTSGVSHHLTPYSIVYTSPRGPHRNGLFVPGLPGLPRDSCVGLPKLCQPGLPRLWSRITLRADLGSWRGLKQSCSSRQELSNGMSHVVCSLLFRVDSRLLMVGSQNWQTPGSSTPGPSFAHNLCFRCPNEQCKPILDIYASRAFQWYKERHKQLRFGPSNLSLKFWESTGTPSAKVGVALGVWRLTPSHSLALPGVSDVTPRLPLGPHPCNPFCLGREPKVRVATLQLPLRAQFRHWTMVNGPNSLTFKKIGRHLTTCMNQPHGPSNGNQYIQSPLDHSCLLAIEINSIANKHLVTKNFGCQLYSQLINNQYFSVAFNF